MFKMFKVSSYEPFEYLHQELWPKERTKIKVSILFPTIRGLKSPLIMCV